MLALCSGWELGCLSLRQVRLWAGAGRWACRECQTRPYGSGRGERWPGSEAEVPPAGPARRTLKEWTLQVSPFGRLRARLPCHLAVRPLDPLTYPDGDRVLVAVCGLEDGEWRVLDSLLVKYDETLEEMAIVSDSIDPQTSVEVNAPLKFGKLSLFLGLKEDIDDDDDDDDSFFLGLREGINDDDDDNDDNNNI
ncbi:hypothetical protein P7K49_025440 [Saguinus oedipus]|uniref:Uncharacterized protein n=1 Tax=Saguinus oedipus TaxID=9490 RepID=A0ABQ9UH78_SAGOE|nr:hypothetical protein P7K49_025440 [Saguinus oedipus]